MKKTLHILMPIALILQIRFFTDQNLFSTLKTMKKNFIIGLLMLAFGVFSLYWAQTHSPDSGTGVKLGREISGSYSLSAPGYIFSLVFATALIVSGGLRAWKSR